MPNILAVAVTAHNLILVVIIAALIVGIALATFAYIRTMSHSLTPPSDTVRTLVAGHYPVAAMFQYRNETGASWQQAQRVIDNLRSGMPFAA